MSVLGVNHINIRTLDIAGTARFYTEILGLRYDGPREVDGFERNWLFDETGAPIIHLRALAPSSEATGALDHIALTCRDLVPALERMRLAGIGFATRDNPSDGIVQVFLKDPNGIALELNFPLQSESHQMRSAHVVDPAVTPAGSDPLGVNS